MNKIDLEKKLIEENLLCVYDRGEKKFYVDESKVFINKKWENMINVFGVYKWDEDNFVCFMTDGERGIPYYTNVFSTESEACRELYEMAVRLKYIHDKGL